MFENTNNLTKRKFERYVIDYTDDFIEEFEEAEKLEREGKYDDSLRLATKLLRRYLAL